MAYTLNVNGTNYTVDVPEDTPLLWVLRDIIGLTGTKYGCGIERCYACTILINGEEAHSCVVQVTEGVGRKITTIEGLSSDRSDPIQQAWITHQVPQCGYCQSGQIMATQARRLQGAPGNEIARDLGNLCVCGTYQRIREALTKL